MDNLIELQRQSESIAPDARIEERKAVLDRLDLQPQHVVCDVPAWGGYFARGVSNPGRVICLEPAAGMVNAPGAKIVQSSTMTFAIPSVSVDRVASLVGLHHHPRKQVFAREVARVLKAGGIAVVSEVQAGTSVAEFLNVAVNRYSQRGHKGEFFAAGDLATLMRGGGFVNVTEELVQLNWVFDSMSQLSNYCRALFAMTKATDSELMSAIEGHFAIQQVDGKVCLPWPLVYAVGVRS